MLPSAGTHTLVLCSVEGVAKKVPLKLWMATSARRHKSSSYALTFSREGVAQKSKNTENILKETVKNSKKCTVRSGRTSCIWTGCREEKMNVFFTSKPNVRMSLPFSLSLSLSRSLSGGLMNTTCKRYSTVSPWTALRMLQARPIVF